MDSLIHCCLSRDPFQRSSTFVDQTLQTESKKVPNISSWDTRKATCWLVLIMPVGRNRLLVVNTLKTPLQCIWWCPPSAKARPAPMCSSIWCITYSPFASINNIQANTNTVRLKNINSASPWKCSRFPSVFKFSGGVLFCSCSLGFKIFFTDILTRCKPDNEQFAVFIWLSTGQ